MARKKLRTKTNHPSSGQKLRRIRKMLGYSQSEFGELLGRSQHSLSDYETGRSEVPQEVMTKAAGVLQEAEAQKSRDMTVWDIWCAFRAWYARRGETFDEFRQSTYPASVLRWLRWRDTAILMMIGVSVGYILSLKIGMGLSMPLQLKALLILWFPDARLAQLSDAAFVLPFQFVVLASFIGICVFCYDAYRYVRYLGMRTVRF